MDLWDLLYNLKLGPCYIMTEDMSSRRLLDILPLAVIIHCIITTLKRDK